MKKILITLTFILALSATKAQITNIKVPGDSTIIINNTYAGILASSNFSADSLSVAKTSSIRFGFKATYSPFKWLSIISTEAYQTDIKNQILVINQFWFKLKFGAISTEAGYMPTLATESRPTPASADGQFETWTEASIPGMGLGMKVKYNFNNYNSYIGAGVSQSNNAPEYHLRYSSPHFKASIYYNDFSRKFGTSTVVDVKRLYDVTVFSQDNRIANLACFKLDRRNKIDWFCDSGYGIKEKKIIRFESGLLKNFSGNYLKGLFGLSYCKETKSFKGYLFIHI